MQTRRFDAAAGGRRWQGTPTFGPINAEVGAAAGPVRRRATYFARNNPWIANGVSALVANIVGPGIQPISKHPDPAVRKALHEAWARWVSSADADGVTDGYGLQALALRTCIEQGECFAQIVATSGGPRVRLLDPEMVPIEETRELGDGRRIVQGIELDAAGQRVAYHVHRARPDIAGSPRDLVRIPSADCCQLYVPLAPGQLRGVSWLAPVLLRLHELDLYEDAQLVRQKVSALFAGFVVDPNGTGGGFDGAAPAPGVLESGLEPGTLKALPPGTDVRFSEPAQVGDSVDFLKLQLRSIAAGLGVPEYLLTGDLSQASYGSLRAALLEFRTRAEQLQHQVLVPQLCRPLWRAVVLHEVFTHRLAAEPTALLDCEWITPSLPWIDPEKDARAAEALLAAGLTSRRRVVAGFGWDVEEIDREIAADRDRARSLGLAFPFRPTATGGRTDA